MANIASLYELALPFLPGAEIPVLRMHARRTLRDFLRRSTVWRTQLPFPTVADTSQYRLTPVQGEVANIHRVELNESALPPATEARRALTQNAAQPRAWFSQLLPVIELYPKPDAVYAVNVEVSLTIPLLEAVGNDTFPDDIFNEVGEYIRDGVCGSMMMMPGKPWTQAAGAVNYMRTYDNAIHNLRARFRDGGQPNVSTARGPRIV